MFFKDKDIILNNMKNLENIHGRMDLIMKDSGEKGKEMVKEHYSWKILCFIMVNLKMIKNMVKALLNIIIDIKSMANGFKINLKKQLK